jgi:hypothetical protein
MDAALLALLQKARESQVSETDRETQRVSFAYGNSNFENENITRDTVVRESERLKQSHEESH